jgi:hypothetical protein
LFGGKIRPVIDGCVHLNKAGARTQQELRVMCAAIDALFLPAFSGLVAAHAEREHEESSCLCKSGDGAAIVNSGLQACGPCKVFLPT